MSGHSDATLPESRRRSRSDGSTTLKSRVDLGVSGQGQDQGQGQTESDPSGQGQGYGGQRYHGSKAWWSVGEFLHQGITHQSVGLSLGRNEEETWDLSDSLADLYQAVTQRQYKGLDKGATTRSHNRSDSGGAMGRSECDMRQDIRRWLDEDTSNGYIRVFASDLDSNSRLFPCTLSTSAQKICLQMGIPGNSLHVQLSGDVIRRMEPFDCPLAIQNEYLAGLGYSNIRYIQEEGPSEDLAYLVRFYAGKPLSDFTYSRNQLSTYAYIRKGKLLHQWTRRLCVISGTRLLIYREKGAEPTAVQLARGAVEEVLVKGQSLVLKLTSTLQGERSLYMSFSSQDDYSKWLRKIRKATAKLPGKADLSNCHLEFLPETVFINTELEILILRHNALRERPLEEDIYTIGWLDDLPRFNCLRSLNLADNQLTSFPLSLTSIRSLVELNLASNKLEEVPSQIAELVNLQVLHLHNNMLSSLPEELGQMRNLAVVVLAFNKFAHVPVFLLQSRLIMCKVDSVIMAGNQISRLPAEHLAHMSHIKKIDLRLNRLQLLPTETAKFQSLEHVTHVDIRENQVTDLDVRAIRQLAYLNCERNKMRSMQLNGSSLKNVFASHNSLQTISINPKPEWLVTMDVSHNKLTDLPAWLPDCFFLVNLDVSHNLLRALPERLFTDGRRLKVIKANHNRLTSVPEKIRTDTLEELHLQHNTIRHLSGELFLKATRLRYLNVTKNKLCDLPPPNKNDSYNKLQELYLSFNHLANRALEKICCFPRLRVLHMARNKLSVMEEIDIEKLEQLSELNVSANNLTYLPAALGRHPKLQVLRANCNLLQELPNFKNSSGLKVLEVSSNHLVNVDMSNLMASQVSLLDISANPSILVKSHDLEAAKKRLCMLDMRGQNWSLEDLRSPSSGEEDNPQRWQTGLSQTSGIRNKLSVTTINKPQFSDSGGGEALFAVFDGGRNETIARLLCDVIPASLREERAKSKDPEVYLKYCLLSSHRNLKTKGQKLGASAVIAHLHKDDRGQDILSVANVGDSQVVLCRQRRVCLLSRPFVVSEDVEDTRRVVNVGGIVTEDGRVSGVTNNTRLLGCSYLYPHVIPDPYVASVTLTSDDSALIVANQGLWQFVSYEEAVREIKDIPDPVVAAKRLQDLAQGYGSRENIAVLVVRLMLSPEERVRIHDLMRVQRKAQKELLKVLSPLDNLLQLRDGVPKVEELNEVIIDKYGHAKKGRRGSRKTLYGEDGVSSIGSSVIDGLSEASKSESALTNSAAKGDKLLAAAASVLGNSRANSTDDRLHGSSLQTSKNHFLEPEHREKEQGSPRQSHYRKRNAATPQTTSENAIDKRICKEIKARELQNALSRVLEKDGGAGNYERVGYDENERFVSPQMNDTDPTANWIAQKPRDVNRANNPDEWKELLQQRLTKELVDREIKKMIQEESVKENSGDNQNWATQQQRLSKKTSSGFSSDGILSGSITRPNDNHTGDEDLLFLSRSDSRDSIDSEVVRMIGNTSGSHGVENNSFRQVGESAKDSDDNNLQDTMAFQDQNGVNDDDLDFEEDRLSVSPSESVSSIDLRLHNEADEIYRLRYFHPSQSHKDLLPPSHSYSSLQGQLLQEDELGSIYPPPPSFVGSNPGSVMLTEQEKPTARPLSPDSLISQDDFVKPPISVTNIDRDALLFHQMQMARAQAHAGSVASLDSVQSAPMHTTSRRDIFPQAKASSHSIEVLVNIGEGEDYEKERTGKTGSQVLGRKSGNGRGDRWGSIDQSEAGSTSTITGSREANIDSVSTMESAAQKTIHHQSPTSSQERLRYTKQINGEDNVNISEQKDATTIDEKTCGNMEFDEDNINDNDDDGDRDTLVGTNEESDIANLDDVEDDNFDDTINNAVNAQAKTTVIKLQKSTTNNIVSKEIIEGKPSDSSLITSFTRNEYDPNDDSDSDESIGNVSLGDGYTAIEFPTNANRNGSLSMLNVLESESEDYPDLFMKKKVAVVSSFQNSRTINAKPTNEVSLRPESIGSHTQVPTVSKVALKPLTFDKNVPVSRVNPQAKSQQLEGQHNDDYEDIDNLSEETNEANTPHDLGEMLLDDINLYEEMQYSPTEAGHHKKVQLESPPTDQPTEEDIDALYAKVNKLKMEKIRSDPQDKADIDSLLLIDQTGKDRAVADMHTYGQDADLPSSRRNDFGFDIVGEPLDKDEEIPLSSTDGLPRIPPRPPLPLKPKKGFSSVQKKSPTEKNTNGSPSSSVSAKKDSPFHKRTEPVYAHSQHNASQPSGSVRNSKPGSHTAEKLSNGNHDLAESISQGTSLLNKPPPRARLTKPASFQYEAKPRAPVPESKPSSHSVGAKSPAPNSTAKQSNVSNPERNGSLKASPPPRPERPGVSKQPPPLPPKKPYLQQAPSQPPHRPPFPLKPQHSQQPHPTHVPENVNTTAHYPHQQTTPHLSSYINPAPYHRQDNDGYRPEPVRPPAPKPRLSKKSTQAPLSPSKTADSSFSFPSNQVQSSRQVPLPPSSSNHPVRSQTAKLPPGGARIAFPHVEEQGDDEIDTSVLSAHELYPDSHCPGSSQLPNSAQYPIGSSHLPSKVDMAVATSRLPTQRSIIITYL